MNKKALSTLEYNKIIDLLKGHASTEKGKEYCEKLIPISNEEKILARQKETSDAFSRLVKDGSIDFSGISDVTPLVKHLEIGGHLNSIELLSIASLLRTTTRAKNYGRSRDVNLPDDSLSEYFDRLEPYTNVREEIERCILGENEFADDASPALKAVRRQMAITSDKIRTTLTKMLNSATMRDNLQDSVITMRNGRYCLPVKAEAKASVPGMVHDQSQTGSTYFIEPMSVVNLNNELRELELKEAEEIDKILTVLSELVAEDIHLIKDNFYILSELDFIFAKGKLAVDMNAVEPVFNTKGIVNLRNARHPLLDKATVRPIDIHLGDEFNTLIITGPNTGGKTVSLKTLGLLTLMGQAGLHIPAGDRSELAIFNSVYADIGDEQSIEQSLSTFSSHMTNIVSILNAVRERVSDLPDDNTLNALVLFDELCAGTDPSEGAALAQSILEYLRILGVRTMSTTHYSELKMYALSTEGVENAACEFSLETLSPTYRLLIGVPGKSNAFAISKKLGLSDDIIDASRDLLSDDNQSFEDLLIDLEQRRIAMEADQLTIKKERAAIEAIRTDLEEKQSKLNDSRDKILQEANLEASLILKEAKDTADETIRLFNKAKSSNMNIAELEKIRSEVGQKLSKSQEKASERKAKAPEYNPNVPKNLKIGDRVKVLSMNMIGTVHTLPDKKGNLEVQMGIIRSTVKLNDLVKVADADSTTLNGQAIPGSKARKKMGGTKGTGSFSKAATISPEVKLLGMTTDEAIQELDKYIDDAYLSNLSTIRIVHGKGTGALRKAVHEYLRRNPHIKQYNLAEFGEGDAGVTIAELK